ncbi:hypothetical protein ACP4OV_010997 [Aristida adscensionis]
MRHFPAPTLQHAASESTAEGPRRLYSLVFPNATVPPPLLFLPRSSLSFLAHARAQPVSVSWEAERFLREAEKVLDRLLAREARHSPALAREARHSPALAQWKAEAEAGRRRDRRVFGAVFPVDEAEEVGGAAHRRRRGRRRAAGGRGRRRSPESSARNHKGDAGQQGPEEPVPEIIDGNGDGEGVVAQPAAAGAPRLNAGAAPNPVLADVQGGAGQQQPQAVAEGGGAAPNPMVAVPVFQAHETAAVDVRPSQPLARQKVQPVYADPRTSARRMGQQPTFSRRRPVPGVPRHWEPLVHDLHACG